ncbi:MAG: hypothetical protein ABWK05_08155 [Pyrobaculum sp.]
MVKVFQAVMAICNIDDPRILKAALYIKEGVGVFDAFHTAFAGEEIISSDHVYERLGLRRLW